MPGPTAEDLISPVISEADIFRNSISERKLRLQQYKRFSQGDSAGCVRDATALSAERGQQNMVFICLVLPSFLNFFY